MQVTNAAFKADMNDVCENRILYNCSANFTTNITMMKQGHIVKL